MLGIVAAPDTDQLHVSREDYLVRKELRGVLRPTPFTFFWNAWLEKKYSAPK